MDQDWSEVHKTCDENGIKKYLQLFLLVKCVLTLSYTNSAPQRGFSINKIMLDAHGYCMQENTIEALHLVKDGLLRIGGAMKFNITTSNFRSQGGIWEMHS